MKKIAIACIIVGLLSHASFAGEEVSNEPLMITEAEMTESMKFRDDCYQLIADKKFDEVFQKISTAKQLSDKIDLYLSLGYSSLDKDVIDKVIKELNKIKSSDERYSYLESDVKQLNFVSLSKSEKVTFLKSIDNFSTLVQYLHRINNFNEFDNKLVVYDRLESLFPSEPSSMDIMSLLAFVNVSEEESLQKKESKLIAMVFESAKKLDLQTQFNVIIQIANQNLEMSDTYVSYLKSTFEGIKFNQDKVNIAIQLCFNNNLKILNDNVIASIERELTSMSQEDNGNVSTIYSLIQLAECQKDGEKIKQLVSKLPKEEQEIFSMPSIQSDDSIKK